MTPYRRIIQSDDIPGTVKAKLTEVYEQLNPAELRRMIDKIQRGLWTQYNDKKKGDHAVSKLNDFVYNLKEATI